MDFNIEQYIKDRVDEQIKWYDKKSIVCKRMYKIFQTIEIIIAALIPLLSGFVNNNATIAFTVGALGSVIAIIEAVTKLNNYHENWVEYRATCELLRYQKQLFISASFPYNSSEESPENVFVRNIESIISSENGKWKAATSTVRKEKN